MIQPRSLIVAFLTARAACLGQVALGGAQSGFVTDHAAQSLRPVIGIPGAAYLGRRVALPFGVREAEVRGGIAVVVSSEEEPRAYLVRGLGGAEPTARLLGAADSAHLSDQGTVALLADSREGTLRFVTGLDSTPAPSLPAPGAARLAAFEGESGCAFLLGGKTLEAMCADRPAERRALRELEGDAAAMFYSEAHGGLFVADRELRRVIRLAPPVETSEIEVLAEGLADLKGVRAISKHEIAAVHAEPARAVVIDLRRRAVTGAIELPAPPEKMAYLAAGRILELSRVNRSPLMVIDLAQDRGAFLIPAGESQ